MFLHGSKTLRVLSCFGLCVTSVMGVLQRRGMVQGSTEVRNVFVNENSFAGTLPDGGMRAMLALTKFVIMRNSFTGMLPESGFGKVTAFHIYANRFAGALPDGGMRAMLGVTAFNIADNSFTGRLPDSGLGKVTRFYICQNRFAGTLPDGGIRVMLAVLLFRLEVNSFTGMLPESRLREVELFYISNNHFAGALPDGGLRAMLAVADFVIYKNIFTGALPESGLGTVTGFYIFVNRFAGALPDGGMRAMLGVTTFHLLGNSFTGRLPDSGLGKVTRFYICQNRFAGALPDGGMRAMLAVMDFTIGTNCFTGRLPESGLREVTGIYIHYNFFAGTLPAELSHARTLSLSHNCFEGPIPSSLEAPVALFGHNLLQGSIPQNLLDGRDPFKKWVAVDGMFHEGTVPASASRMTMSDIIMSLGHGLRGLLPSIPGTISLLSLWENGFEGHLPEMRINETSLLFVHANGFSCQLPRHRDVTPKASLALIGNHFARPRRLPAWITTAEQPSDMFLVSERQGKMFVMVLLGCACIFCLATFWLQSANQVVFGRFARAKSAWNETSQHQNRLVIASCVPALLYNNMQSLACTVTTAHLRFHFVSTRPYKGLFVVCLHACILQSAALFYCRHVTWDQPAVTSSRVHTLWFWACLLTAAPGVVYSTVKAVPGFLQISGFWQWVVSNTVTIVSAAATSFGLDFLATKLSGPKCDPSWLQLLGSLQASIVLPGHQ